MTRLRHGTKMENLLKDSVKTLLDIHETIVHSPRITHTDFSSVKNKLDGVITSMVAVQSYIKIEQALKVLEKKPDTLVPRTLGKGEVEDYDELCITEEKLFSPA